MRIVRTGRSLGVILHREQRQVLVPHALQRVVVKIDVRQLDFARRQRIGINREVVIVRRDLDLAGVQLFHGMIPPMMAEFQLVGFAAQSDARQLMP